MRKKIFFILTIFVTPFTLMSQNKKYFDSYFEIEILPIGHLQNTNSENYKINGEVIPNYQLAFTYRKIFTNFIGLTYNFLATSFGNKFSTSGILDGNNVELGTGPNRQSGNLYYSFYVNAAFSNFKSNSPLSAYIGIGISVNQVYGLYDSHGTGASNSSTGSSIGLYYDAYRISRLGYFINIAADISLFKIKKVNTLNLKTGFVIGLKSFNEVKAILYENHISVDRATINSKGSGIYLGLTYRWQKGRRYMERIKNEMN